jgi:uncharacterized protein
MKTMNPVVHFEIPADQQERAKTFYTSVFDWEMQDMPVENDVYTFAITSPLNEDNTHKEKGAINGGMFKRSSELQTPVITIRVPSIEEFSKKIENAGGNMVLPKGEVPGMGYYAYFKDTEGNIMGLWQDI